MEFGEVLLELLIALLPKSVYRLLNCDNFKTCRESSSNNKSELSTIDIPLSKRRASVTSLSYFEEYSFSFTKEQNSQSITEDLLNTEQSEKMKASKYNTHPTSIKQSLGLRRNKVKPRNSDEKHPCHDKFPMLKQSNVQHLGTEKSKGSSKCHYNLRRKKLKPSNLVLSEHFCSKCKTQYFSSSADSHTSLNSHKSLKCSNVDKHHTSTKHHSDVQQKVN